ncbi:MAG: LysR family transcriptional regulator [Microbacterium sp.]|uniref:LysR family transcriptional regulator n=1 Tax=Microbacterium sp. TaxID=51671 RepID=UPI0039E60DC4
MTLLSNRDLDLLVCLRVLLEECNVTRAAERLQMGQPAMSVALSRLRLQFGDDLLVRVGREFELTAFARSLRSQVEHSVSLIDEVLGATEPFDPSTSVRSFSLVAPDHVVAELWPSMARIAADAPGLSFEIVAEPAEPVTNDQALLKRDYVTVPPAGDMMSETATLYRDRFVCVLDAANRERPADGEPISWDAFRRLPHVVAKAEKDFRSPVDLVLGELGFAREPVVRLTSYLQLPAAVAGTDLCAVVPERVARRLAAATGTVIAELPFGPIDSLTALWWHPARRGDPGHAWLTARLIAEFAVP